MKNPVIFWFRTDLRLYDNLALLKAIKTNHPLLFVYILNEAWFRSGPLGFSRLSQFRYNHLLNSLARLNNALGLMGARLHVFKGDPVALLVDIAKNVNAEAIYAHHEYASEELRDEKHISSQIPLYLYWGNMVYPPSHVPFKPDTSPYYYTKYMKKVIELSPSPLEPGITGINHFNKSLPYDHLYLPEVSNSTSPSDEMRNFIQSGAFEDYHTSRELFEGDQYSSFLSPFLADGSLSANLFYRALTKKQMEDERFEPSVTKLKQQLIWRDYYRFLFLRYGNKLFSRHGIRNKNRDRYDDKSAFRDWMNGQTDHPLINAFMNELRSTGFLSNRGRMLVSYYLSKVMQVNWLWGAAWFEHILIDYDVCNNYGNWAYQSGVGTDSRFNRSFNLDKQMQKFDPKGLYVKKWQ